ncbi:MAG: O-antigen ligase [Sphingobacteriales bacterium]|jgi:O-antigen ligase
MDIINNFVKANFKGKSVMEIGFLVTIFLVVFTLPFDTRITNFLAIVLTIFSIINAKNFVKLSKETKIFIILSVTYFCLYLIGLIYTSSLNEGIKLIETKLGILLFLFVFTLCYKNQKQTFHSLLQIYIIGTSIVLVVCVISAFWSNYLFNNLEELKTSYFSNHRLGAVFGLHASYISLHIILSIFSAMWLSLYEKVLQQKHALILTFVFSLFLLLFSARMEIISFLILSACTGIFYIVKGYVSKKWVTLTILILGISSIFLLSNSYFSDRFKQVFTIDTNSLIGTSNENGVTQRVFIWKKAINLIKEKPLIGYGLGDGQKELTKIYDLQIQNTDSSEVAIITALNGFKKVNFNAHCQYLEVTLSLGFIGLLSLLSLFFYPFYLAWTKKEPFYMLFIVFFAMCCLTESMLNRQSGVFFFSIFNSLFFVYFINKSKD